MPTLSQVARISLKNILFPTDFSPSSSSALPFALSLARIYGASVIVAHALAPERHAQVIPEPPLPDDLAWIGARHEMKDFLRDSMIGTTPCKAVLERGDLSDVIPAMIRDNAVDLVVLGTHGRRGISKVVLGSNAEKIYRFASCPVLTIGPKAREAANEWRIRCILCPLDLAEDPEPALHYGLSLAEENQAELVMMHAVPMVPWQHRASVEDRTIATMEGLIPEEAKNWCTPEYAVRWEHPAQAILHAAAQHSADLIVMGVHKARAATLSAHLPWPVASEVVSRARCPVLTVRV